MKKPCLGLSAAILLSLFLQTNAGALDYKFSMSYIYFGSALSYTSLVDDARGSLDEVSPNYFSLDKTGNLVITNAASKSFVKEMHARGIRVVPYLTNDWDRQAGISALNNGKALVDDLAQAVSDYDLDGVNIDLENLNENQRTDYVEFVRLLHDKLPVGKMVTVAVAANPNGISRDWQGSYDYAGLAQYCDYLMIMAYDEHWDGIPPQGSGPGPVGSMSFAERSIQYALKCQVPKEKLVLGLPFYGRIWSDSGSSPYGHGISNTRIIQLIADYHGDVTFDSVSRSARAVFTVKSGDVKPVIDGAALKPGTYTIWYDNEQTVKEKLDLVQKYGIKGAGSWSLGQEDDATWTYYKLRLNGCTFDDIETSWAKDGILNAYLNGWVNGMSPEVFGPDVPLTRAEAAAMLVRMLGYPVAHDAEFSFDDTKGSWAEDIVSTARHYNIISGVGGNQFAPDRPVTRQEIAVMLGNIRGIGDDLCPTSFSDVSSETNPWSYAAIAALSADGVFTGYTDGSFRPTDSVTRAEMAVLMTRMQPD